PGKHLVFEDIVLDGILAERGMVGFGEVLTREDAEAVHAYIISEAQEAWKYR
ncbi:MAG: hypothetical protein HUJ31_00570, partial [Pseudomonadales bacterium]|nr:hypothetical protein [Pseudomonadales bacterium]